MTATAKIVAPQTPWWAIPRPDLEDRLAEAITRRLTAVVAGAGFGKSTLLGSWSATVNCAWYTVTPEDAVLPALARGLMDSLRLRVPGRPSDLAAAIEGSRGPDADTDEQARAQAFAASLCDGLQERLSRDLVLVIDDVHEVGSSGAAISLIESLCRQAPQSLHVVLASRTELPFAIERLRSQGHVLDVAGSELSFTVEEVRAMLAATIDPEAAELAEPMREATGGWPAAIRLAIEALRAVPPQERARALEAIPRRGGPLFGYLAREVFEREALEVRELVRTVAALEAFTPELCETLGVKAAGDTLASLSRRGLFLEPHRTGAGWFSLSPLVREFALEYLPLDEWEAHELHRHAAAWLEAHGHTEEALRSYAAIGDHAEIARLLGERGLAMLSAGAVEAIVRAAEVLPHELRRPEIEQLEGEARQIRGDWEGALTCFERAGANVGELSPGVAWRMGLIHHLRGQLDEALTVYRRGRIDGSNPRDEALLLAWTGTAHWLRGEAETSRALAARAFETATASGNSQALAAAHTVLAMLAALEGDRAANDAHYIRALDHAERASDVLQIIRIRTNRSSHYTEEGLYQEALDELDIAIRLADLSGFASFRALGLSNRGEARFRLGRLDEAITDFEAARSQYQRLGSRMVCYPLMHLGEVYRERGDTALARQAYEEAVAFAEESGDVQGLVPALAGLARVRANDEPEDAERLAERALSFGPGLGYVAALLATGVVALRRGDRGRALASVAAAAKEARSRRDRAGLAEALEIEAMLSEDPAHAAAKLEGAAAIWRDIRSPIGEARAELALAGLVSGPAARALAERAERRFRELGARGYASGAAALLASLARQERAPIVVRSLGGFGIVRDGDAVPLVEWQSKKARDLLKILVARRGRPTPREFLMEALWPEDDPAKVANRLSVALTTVRTVLDPNKRFGAEHFVAADKNAIGLDTGTLVIDVEHFLAGASQGLKLRREGRRAEATERLAAAEAAYAGDFLEEDAYEDWAAPLREEARAAYISVARALAEDAARAHDHDAATRYLLRILERDAFDEQAHLGLVSALVAAGRHGEARRAYRTYSGRMEEIGVESAPFPGAARGA